MFRTKLFGNHIEPACGYCERGTASKDGNMVLCVELSFAVDCAEKYDLSDSGMLETVTSHVYAAYGLCDDPGLAGALYVLWNDLLFRGETFLDNEDLLIVRLNAVQEALHTQTSS